MEQWQWQQREKRGGQTNGKRRVSEVSMGDHRGGRGAHGAAHCPRVCAVGGASSTGGTNKDGHGEDARLAGPRRTGTKRNGRGPASSASGGAARSRHLARTCATRATSRPGVDIVGGASSHAHVRPALSAAATARACTAKFGGAFLFFFSADVYCSRTGLSPSGTEHIIGRYDPREPGGTALRRPPSATDATRRGTHVRPSSPRPRLSLPRPAALQHATDLALPRPAPPRLRAFLSQRALAVSSSRPRLAAPRRSRPSNLLHRFIIDPPPPARPLALRSPAHPPTALSLLARLSSPRPHAPRAVHAGRRAIRLPGRSSRTNAHVARREKWAQNRAKPTRRRTRQMRRTRRNRIEEREREAVSETERREDKSWRERERERDDSLKPRRPRRAEKGRGESGTCRRAWLPLQRRWWR